MSLKKRSTIQVNPTKILITFIGFNTFSFIGAQNMCDNNRTAVGETHQQILGSFGNCPSTAAEGRRALAAVASAVGDHLR